MEQIKTRYTVKVARGPRELERILNEKPAFSSVEFITETHDGLYTVIFADSIIVETPGEVVDISDARQI